MGGFLVEVLFRLETLLDVFLPAPVVPAIFRAPHLTRFACLARLMGLVASSDPMVGVLPE